MRISSPLTWLIGFILLSTTAWLIHQLADHPYLPSPTGGILSTTNKIDHRKAWFEQMHRTAPGTNWRDIEAQTRLRRRQHASFESQRRSPCETTTDFADGQLSGRWVERGSNNQSGSIIEIAYNPEEDRIWLISAGGTLWSSARKQIDWQIENQQLQFDRGFLELVPIPAGKKRLLAFSEQLPHFSDDNGKTWKMASGFSGTSPQFTAPTLLQDQSVFVLWKPDYYAPFALYRSDDWGNSYKKILGLDAFESEQFTLCRPHRSQQLFLARKEKDGKLRLQEWVPQQEVLVDVSSEQALQFGKAPANLQGRRNSAGELQLFAYTEKDGTYILYQSGDKGKNWKKLSELPHAPWEVGLYLSPSQENVLYMGEIEAHRSVDGGRSWESINHWWEYYDNIEGALHADIMRIREFQIDNTAFTLVGHHGGISISYDQFETQQNIGLTDLNTSQYYCVRTDPINPDFVYAGSQDQGFQRAKAFTEKPNQTYAFEQVISGDYGTIVFGRAGTALWTVYPGGWINYYDQPQDGQVSASFELKSEDEPVWLPPLMSNPESGKNGIYMAGGNLEGGPGSYLIGIEYENKKLLTHQINYDFQTESAGGALSALASAKPSHLYTATTNGRFFYSHDGGANWEQNVNFIPEGHYLYGQAIYISKFDPEMVVLAGSGYNNPPVYTSRDGGKNFYPMADGLPPTLVLGLAANSDESLFFAATEAGPYVYHVANQRWYDLSTACTPTQTYWSVEFVPSEQTVRFGTYGRGIWDLQLGGDMPTPVVETAKDPLAVKIYPNPTTGPLYIEISDLSADYTITIHDASGRRVLHEQHRNGDQYLELDLSDLPPGLYLLQLESSESSVLQKLLLH